MADSDTIMAYVVDNATNFFQDRVKYFFQKAAIAIMNEDKTTPKHKKRVDFGGFVLSGDFSSAELAIAVATNSTIAGHIIAAAAIPDADIEFAVNSMFTAFAISVT